MALARSSIDRLLRTGVLPPSMTDRLQCTLAGQPMRLMQPGVAAHAAVTPTTLRARLHTVSMWEGHYSNYAYDQMDRHQMNTVNEVSGEIQHEWDEPTANEMVQNILNVAKHERINIHLTITSATTFAITPGPSLNDNSQLEKTCRQYCDRLRLSGVTGLSCRFNHAPPHRPNPIPQMLSNLMQYEPAIYAGMARWSRSSRRVSDAAPELEGGGARFDVVAQAGTGRFQSPPEETALALRSTNTELVKSNAALKQQVAQLGAEQLTLRNEARAQIQTLMEAQQEENRKYMAEMKELHRATAAAATETQAKLDALVQAVTNLPEGAQVLRSVFSSPGTSSSPTGGTSEPESPGTSEAEAKAGEDAPPPTGGAPPSPEHADGLDEEHEPCAQPTTIPLPGARLITTPWALARERLSTVVRNGTAGSSRRLARSLPSDCSPGPGPSERGLKTAAAGPAGAPPRLPARSHVPDRHATDAHGNGPTPLSPGATPFASESDQGARTETSSINAAPGTPPAASPEGNAALRLERALLQDAIRIRRAHMLRTLELARIWWSLAEASCDRNVCLPDHEALLRHLPTGLDPGPRAERAFTQAERLNIQDRQTPPQRHPGDPLDPCDSFSTMSSPEERNRSHARILWALAALDGAMDRSDDARIPPMTDGQEMNTSSTSTLEAMPPSEEPTSLPTADPQPSPAQPIFPNRHLSDDERGTSSKYPEVKGDGAWPPGADGNAHGNDHYEDTPPSSTDHPRPEHMVNAAEPDGRGVVIRAGSGFGSSVSDENSTRPPEHVSANEKASPPAQDSLEDFNRKAAEAHLASMEAVRANPSAALDLVMLQALGKMLAGIKVHSGRAPPSSLARYGYYPNDSLLPNRQLTEDERGTSAKYPEVKGDGATAKTKKKATAKATKKTATKRSLAIVMTVPSDAPFDDGMDTPISPGALGLDQPRTRPCAQAAVRQPPAVPASPPPGCPKPQSDE